MITLKFLEDIKNDVPKILHLTYSNFKVDEKDKDVIIAEDEKF